MESQGTLRFAADFTDRGEFQLVEISDDFLRQLSAGERFWWKAGAEEEAIFCSQSQTYVAKLVESSNSTYLIQHSDLKAPTLSLSSRVYGHLELIPTRPKLKKLRELVESYPYPTIENADDGAQSMDEMRRNLSWDAIVETTFASADEILSGLKEIGAVQVDGCWRVIDKKHLNEVLDFFFHTCIEKDWDINLLHPQQVSKEIPEYPSWLVLHLLTMFASESLDHANHTTARLDPFRISRFRAQVLFSISERWRYEDFLKAWQESVPEGLMIDLTSLNGIAIVDSSGPEKIVRYFPCSSLPEDPRLRFQALFHSRPRWPAEEIIPYISDLVGGKGSIESLLLKFTRNALVDGRRYYFARELPPMSSVPKA
eukprot:TRINITY_DN3878_c0_g1_i1.p1 TRINITY_DN3878_c0_g1~~TRINITY_DN3878_c0_g1_i1.p1  ORF type:complete len:370 (+),score=83.84 TRINITY_DN3878_c0_g1_i1:76-1185(+)